MFVFYATLLDINYIL